jgi:hypothetical protein
VVSVLCRDRASLSGLVFWEGTRCPRGVGIPIHRGIKLREYLGGFFGLRNKVEFYLVWRELVSCVRVMVMSARLWNKGGRPLDGWVG